MGVEKYYGRIYDSYRKMWFLSGSDYTGYSVDSRYSRGYYGFTKDSTTADSIHLLVRLDNDARAALPAASKINKVTIDYDCDHAAYSNYTNVIADLIIGIPNSIILSSAGAEQGYAACQKYTELRRVSVPVDGSVSGTFEFTNKEQIAAVLDRGIVFVNDKFTSQNEKAAAMCSSAMVGFTVDYEDTARAPEVELTNDTTALKSMVTAPYKLGWSYSQFSGSAQASVNCDLWDLANNRWEIAIAKDVAADLREINIPANKYPALREQSEKVKMRFRVQSAYGTWSKYVETDITLCFPRCENLSPANGENRLGHNAMTLSWSVVPDAGLEIGTYPEKFDIDYSVNGGESWLPIVTKTAVTGTDGAYSYSVPANTIPEGVIKWRVKGYVPSSMSGEYTINDYAVATFTCRVQAETSTATCDGKPQPTISWTSTSQVAYQVRFADYDSGAVYSAEKTHKVPHIYADGLYPLRVRTQASNGEWSAWTETLYVQITNTAQTDALTLAATPTRHAVTLEITDAGTSEKYIIYRDGVAIYAGTAKTFTDVCANGETRYFARALKSSGYYAQSAAVTVDATPKNDCMYDVEAAEWVPLMYSLSRRMRNYSQSGRVTYKYYAGRAKPVAYNPGYIIRQLSAAYAFKTRAEAERLNDAVGRMMIYKDTRGGVVIGIVDDVSIAVNPRIYSAQISLTEIDYEAEVKV